MPCWYEVFDNEEVQFGTRKRVAALGVVAAAAAGATAAGLAAGHVGALPMGVVLVGLTALWVAVIRYVGTRLDRLRRVVWCIKLSDRHVVGYDYTRQRTTFDWLEVHRVELADGGLLVVGPGGRVLEVPFLFPDFAVLSHRVVHYADFYDVPVFVAGHPWEAFDVYAHFPELREGAVQGR